MGDRRQEQSRHLAGSALLLLHPDNCRILDEN
jgi:hypothetical protein